MNGVIALMFSQVIVKIVGLIYKLYLTNKENFGDHGNAIYAAGFQIYTIFLTICQYLFCLFTKPIYVVFVQIQKVQTDCLHLFMIFKRNQYSRFVYM